MEGEYTYGLDGSTDTAASPLLRHQSSLERVIDFNFKTPLSPTQRSNGHRRFLQILLHLQENNPRRDSDTYNRPALVRLTHEYARSDEAKDKFLQAFFRAVNLPLDSIQDVHFANEELEETIRQAVDDYAAYLFDNFFLPLKALGWRTPQPSPASSRAMVRAGGARDFVATPERVSSLRHLCLKRDRHRCVVSRAFDLKTMFERSTGEMIRDEDGSVLDGRHHYTDLEVAHVMPHSLTGVQPDSQMSINRQKTLDILNMFDVGVANYISGVDIDRPYNAITLSHNLHWVFGSFHMFFDAVPEQEHTYTIKLFKNLSLDGLNFPVTRTLFLTPDRTIDPPSPRLLALHRAIAHILHLSAAGEYIDKILRDIEEHGVRADGSTDLAQFVKLRLEGWLEGTVGAC